MSSLDSDSAENSGVPTAQKAQKIVLVTQMQFVYTAVDVPLIMKDIHWVVDVLVWMQR